MKFTEELKNKINEEYNASNFGISHFKLNIDNSVCGARVFKEGWEICKVDELGIMIRELQMMQEAIKKTGVIV